MSPRRLVGSLLVSSPPTGWLARSTPPRHLTTGPEIDPASRWAVEVLDMPGHYVTGGGSSTRAELCHQGWLSRSR